MTTYPAGGFFLTTVTGPAGLAIDLGQLLAGSPSIYQHGGMIVDPDGTTVEAEPGGARYGHLSDYAGRPLLISDAPVQARLASMRLTDSDPHQAPCGGCAASEARLRLAITNAAHDLIGTPYSALDYAALALLHLHLPSGWVRRRVESSGHLICSALVDRAYQRAGIRLFDDGRLPGDVMPSDLAAWADDHQLVTA